MWLEREVRALGPARADASPPVRSAHYFLSLRLSVYNTLRDMRKRQLAHQVLNLAMIVCSALMIWKGLMVVTESESPVVVVLRRAPPSAHRVVERCRDSPPPRARPRSGSMEPAFYRGDILFLHMGFTPFRAGDIVVFKVADREIPIVHRVIKARAPPVPPRGGVSSREPRPHATWRCELARASAPCHVAV